MTAIERCPLLDLKTGLCQGISWNPFNQPSQVETVGWNRGTCNARHNIAKQADCSKHPQHLEWIEITTDDGSNNSKRIIVSKR